MDNETSPTSAPTSALSMPKTGSFVAPSKTMEPSPIVAPGSPAPDANDRNLIFKTLVKDDADITGLVAYSIYKQNKLDWLTAFETIKGRTPNDAELASYIIGEGTPRRLATYRHLAEATLAGNGPDVDGAPRVARGPARGVLADRTTLTAGLVAVYGIIALLFLFGFWMAAHYTMGPR